MVSKIFQGPLFYIKVNNEFCVYLFFLFVIKKDAHVSFGITITVDLS